MRQNNYRSGSGHNNRSFGSNTRRRYSGGGNNRRRYSGPTSFSSQNFRSRGGFRGASISHNKYIAKAAIDAKPQEIHVKDYTFDDLNISDVLKSNIRRKEFKYPTKIQDQTIKHILEGRDVLGLAETGSGKTAAFLIPLIDKVLKDPKQRVLIICPTRELAEQTREELFIFSRGTQIRSVLTIGGASIHKQISFLRRRPAFIIGTPGRLKDLDERGAIDLETFNNIVLDEVDRMLDMGFIHDIKFLISKLPNQKQTLFFSATMPSAAEYVANNLMKDPVKVQTEKQSPQKNVDQDIVKVRSNMEKMDKLHELLNKAEVEKTLIFSRTKRGTDKLTRELQQRGFRVDAIHGDKSQFIRTKVITKFKTDQIKILVATDVAARGLDIRDISHVINFDEPASYDDYIHRIGRTGRAGKTGVAITFVV